MAVAAVTGHGVSAAAVAGGGRRLVGGPRLRRRRPARCSGGRTGCRPSAGRTTGWSAGHRRAPRPARWPGWSASRDWADPPGAWGWHPAGGGQVCRSWARPWPPAVAGGGPEAARLPLRAGPPRAGMPLPVPFRAGTPSPAPSRAAAPCPRAGGPVPGLAPGGMRLLAPGRRWLASGRPPRAGAGWLPVGAGRVTGRAAPSAGPRTWRAHSWTLLAWWAHRPVAWARWPAVRCGRWGPAACQKTAAPSTARR